MLNIKHITPVLNVSDVPASIAWFEKLGWSRAFTWNDAGMIERAADRNEHGPAQFGAVCNGHCEIFMCRDGQGSQGLRPTQALREQLKPGGSLDDRTPGVWMSWWLESPQAIDEAHEVCKREGVFIACPPTDEPWGVREMRIMHPDGHTFRVSAGVKK
jgi:hypothetical protein